MAVAGDPAGGVDLPVGGGRVQRQPAVLQRDRHPGGDAAGYAPPLGGGDVLQQGQGVAARGGRQLARRDQLPQQRDLVRGGRRRQPPAGPGEAGAAHAGRQPGAGQPGGAVVGPDADGAAVRVPQGGGGVVVAHRDHLLREGALGGRRAAGVTREQRLQDVELDDAGLVLRLPVAESPRLPGAQVFGGGGYPAAAGAQIPLRHPERVFGAPPRPRTLPGRRVRLPRVAPPGKQEHRGGREGHDDEGHGTREAFGMSAHKGLHYDDSPYVFAV